MNGNDVKSLDKPSHCNSEKATFKKLIQRLISLTAEIEPKKPESIHSQLTRWHS